MHRSIHFLSRKEGLFLMISVAVGGLAVWVSYSFAAATSVLFPIADGSYKQWTPTGSVATAHYTKVDESACNGISDYVYTTSVGKKDSYKVDISSIPKGAVITSITVTPCASANSNGGNNSRMKVFYRTGTIDYTHPTVYDLLGTTPTNLSSRSWNGLEMVKVSDTNLEVGAYYESGDKGVRLSRIAVNIVYNTPYPSNLSGTLSCSATGIPQVTLSWSDNSLNEDRFEIARGNAEPASLATYAYTDGPNVTTYSDTNLLAGHTYTYQVFSLKEGVDNYRYYSNIVSVSVPSVSSCGSEFSTATSTPTFSTSTPPIMNNFSSSTPTSTPTLNSTSTPSGYTPTNAQANLSCLNGNARVLVSWSDNAPNETGYSIKRGLSPTSMSAVASTAGISYPGGLYYVDESIQLGSTYYYVVSAELAGVYSLNSSVVSVILPVVSPCISQPPVITPTSTPTSTSIVLPPTNFTATIASSTCTSNIVLSWVDNSTNEDGFRIYRKLSTASLFSWIANISANVTYYVDQNLSPGTYNYNIQVFKGMTSSTLPSINVTVPTNCGL